MIEYLSALPEAVFYTVVMTAVSFGLGAILAIPIMLARTSSNRAISTTARVVIDLVRGLPPLVWLFILYFGISIGRLRLDALQAAIAALTIISAVYLAEIYRGGLSGVGVGQFEAARALGISRWTMARSVITPQALRIALPGMATYAIALLKDSSLASLIGVTDIVYATNVAVKTADAILIPFAIAGGLYLALSAPLAILARSVDRRLRAVSAS